MSKNFRRTRLEEFERIRSRLQGSVVLVEGKRDVETLRRVGFDARFVTCAGNSERVLGRLTEALGENGVGNKVHILTDFDRPGEELRARHAALLADSGIDPDLALGRKLKAVLGFTTVEEVERKLSDLKTKGELNGKNVR